VAQVRTLVTLHGTRIVFVGDGIADNASSRQIGSEQKNE
jgi:hypothetical protein